MAYGALTHVVEHLERVWLVVRRLEQRHDARQHLSTSIEDLSIGRRRRIGTEQHKRAQRELLDVERCRRREIVCAQHAKERRRRCDESRHLYSYGL